MKDRPPRLTRAHLDDLLDGRPTAENPLADLVAAVRAPAQQHELSGLDAALAAFAAAPTGAESSEDSSPAFKRVAGRLLALKVLAVAAGTAVAGGVAYAAVNGTLDSPSGSNSSAVASDSSGAPGSSRAGSSAPGSDKSSDQPGSGSKTPPTASGSESLESGRPSGSATASSSLKGLCVAWLAHPRDVAKVSTDPAFRVLIKAAGGADAVNGYCATLIGTSHASHPTHPTHPVHPTHPAHPSHPAHVVPTVHPVHPTHPVHPVHPTRPAHPTAARNTHTPAAKPSTHTKKPKPTQAASPSTGRHTRSA